MLSPKDAFIADIVGHVREIDAAPLVLEIPQKGGDVRSFHEAVVGGSPPEIGSDKGKVQAPRCREYEVVPAPDPGALQRQTPKLTQPTRAQDLGRLQTRK